MSRPVVPAIGGRTGPSAEPRPAPVALDIGRPRDPVPLADTPERAGPEPERSLAAARGLLARLVPGQAARTAAEFDAAARDAYRSALKLETAPPLAPAPPTARVASGSTSATPTAPVATPAAAHTPAPGASAWAIPARLPAEQSAAPPRRLRPGETAPDFLLRTPTSVAPVADDFFNALIRRVEGDR